MSEEMKKAYMQLDINDKRNQLSDELLIIFELIKRYENAKGINPVTQVKNYDIVNDKNLNEDEILTFFYEDVYNIQQELITLLTVVERQDFNKTDGLNKNLEFYKKNENDKIRLMRTSNFILYGK